MSIKRTKQVSSGSRRNQDQGLVSFNRKDPEPQKSWDELMAGALEDAFKPYSPEGGFAVGDFLAHTTFGRGVVTATQDNRIEVLFQQGPKKLAHRPS